MHFTGVYPNGQLVEWGIHFGEAGILRSFARKYSVTVMCMAGQRGHQQLIWMGGCFHQGSENKLDIQRLSVEMNLSSCAHVANFTWFKPYLAILDNGKTTKRSLAKRRLMMFCTWLLSSRNIVNPDPTTQHPEENIAAVLSIGETTRKLLDNWTRRSQPFEDEL